MFSIAALIPSPPILVPELAGAARAGTDDPDDPIPTLRAAVAAAVGELAAHCARWTVLGVGDEDAESGPESIGTFKGYGVDVTVALSPAAEGGIPDPLLPLPALLAGNLRARHAPEASVSVRVLARDTPVERCVAVGERLRAELDAVAEPRGVLVVADGATTLTLKSPGYLDERAEAQQQALDRALSAGDRAGLLALDPKLCAELGISGRAAYQAAAGLFAADPEVRTRYRAAPFGVGYFVGLWRPGGTE
ncbi:hypothetical protein ACTD5D_12665 [Nocardia takedensis]|uniref:hypothetical protein n=1 Tax=Nocardia takedensis TaxID=259390 RepID=UPI0002EEEA7A|nr:hypothetical protein [Nocardia takedensis]